MKAEIEHKPGEATQSEELVIVLVPENQTEERYLRSVLGKARLWRVNRLAQKAQLDPFDPGRIQRLELSIRLG